MPYGSSPGPAVPPLQITPSVTVVWLPVVLFPFFLGQTY